MLGGVSAGDVIVILEENLPRTRNQHGAERLVTGQKPLFGELDSPV
jgi:hypothetical protein